LELDLYFYINNTPFDSDEKEIEELQKRIDILKERQSEKQQIINETKEEIEILKKHIESL
jgi:predicted  nucleic acid-binding Zn-ribbon protein